MESVAVVGLALGMRHAMDADHVAAVASLAVRTGSSAGSVARLAAWWGVGHATTLIAIGSVALIAGTRIPEAYVPFLEGLVGLMLLVLGVGAMRRPILAHKPSGIGQRKDWCRATLVGAMHGLAGSAALILLTTTRAHSVLSGLAQLALFGGGGTDRHVPPNVTALIAPELLGSHGSEGGTVARWARNGSHGRMDAAGLDAAAVLVASRLSELRDMKA